MAITIIEQPKTHTPIYNDMVLLVSSNLASNPKFMFGLDVRLVIEGTGTLYLGRLKTPAVRTDIGYFNIKELIKYSEYFQSKSFITNQDKSHTIRLTPGEEYASSPSGVATYYPSASDIEFVGFNGSLRLNEFIDFVPTDLINTATIAASTGIGQYIMSSYTQRKNVLKSTLNELTFLCNGGTNTRGIVSYYNSGGLISTQVITTNTANRTDITVDASYNNLAVPAGTTLIGVRLERISNGNFLSDQYEYNLVEACSKYPTLNVYFQNKWGAYDSFIFNKKSTKRDSINRKTYQKQDRYINGYNSYDPAIRTYDSQIKTRHTLSTDWVTEAEMNWLSELVESNNVQFSYDGPLSGGSPATFEMRVYKNSVTNLWGFGLAQTMTGTVAGYTQTFNGVVTDDYNDAPDFYNNELLAMLNGSGFANYFTFTPTYTASYISVLFTANQNGVSYNVTNLNTYTSDQIATFNNTAGVNDNLPTLIPIQIEDTSFEFKTKDNDKLFQLTINAVETSVYNRQNL